MLLVPIFSLGQDKVKFTAAGITCSLCSSAIFKSLQTDKSIIKIDPNLDTQEWYVEYKSGEFKIENLIKKVEDAGFSVKEIYLNDKLILDKNKKKKK